MQSFGKDVSMEEEFFVVVVGGQMGVVDYDEVRHNIICDFLYILFSFLYNLVWHIIFEFSRFILLLFSIIDSGDGE